MKYKGARAEQIRSQIFNWESIRKNALSEGKKAMVTAANKRIRQLKKDLSLELERAARNARD